MTYHTYNFTGFKEADILGNNNGSSFGGHGESFVMPGQATTNFSVSDNDAFLSGDSWCNEHANDRTGQGASITDCDGNVLQNCDRIYAERVIYLKGSDGKTYTMVEIEVEGGNAVGQGDDYFTFYNGGPDFRGTPPAGVTLTVIGTANVKTNYLDYKCLWQDDKQPNRDPVAQDDAATVMENADRSTIFNILSNDTDADGDDLQVVEINGQSAVIGEWFVGSNGGEFCLLEDGCVDFRQGSTEFDYLGVGEELLTSFTYTISDGNGGFSTATATVKVTGKNDAPVAVDDHFGTVSEDAGNISIFAGGDRIVERNDYDVDGDALSIAFINGERPADGTGIEYGQSFAGSNGGMFTVFGPAGFVDFNATFDGNGDFDYLKEGETTTTSFEYTITDGNGGFDTATVTVTVEGRNDGPVAVRDQAITVAGQSVTVDVLANDSDVDGDTLTISDIQGGDGGQVAIVDGKLVYTPDADFTGTDTFEYTITDEGGLTSTAEVTIEVGAGQEPPVLADGTYKLGNHPVTGKIKENVAGGQEFGLRLDGLLSGDAGNGNNTVFDFEHPDSDMRLTIMGDKIRIHGVTYGGRVDINGFDESTTGLFEVDFTYHNSEFRNGDDDFFIDDLAEGTNTGFIKQLTGANAGTITDLSDMAGEYPYTFQLGDGEDDTGLDGHDGISGRGWLFQDRQVMKASDFLFTVHEPVEPPKPTGEIIGHECIHEGDTESYQVKLDSVVTEDTFVTINIDNGTAKQSDGIYQLETIKTLSNPHTYNVELGEQGQLYSANLYDRNQAAYYWNGTHWFEGDLNQLPIGAENLMDDFEVAGAQGDKIVVKIAAGSDTSESFDISALKEIQLGKMFSNQTSTEGTETFSLNIETIGDHEVNMGEKVIEIKDEYANYSPISFDLNGDGIQTLSIDQGVMFDMLVTGTAVKTGWLSGDDGFLAVDNNGDGVISDRSELFGGGVGDGFAKLATFDSNGDGLVNKGDAQFAALKLWQDANENGLTDKGELISLESAGISDLNTAYKNVFSTDAHGNIHGEVSTAMKNGSTIEMTDVYFQVAG